MKQRDLEKAVGELRAAIDTLKVRCYDAQLLIMQTTPREFMPDAVLSVLRSYQLAIEELIAEHAKRLTQ